MANIENKLKKLFDYQRFEKSDRLAKLISETEARYNHELSDDDLSMISAAGDNYINSDADKDKKDDYNK